MTLVKCDLITRTHEPINYGVNRINSKTLNNFSCTQDIGDELTDRFTELPQYTLQTSCSIQIIPDFRRSEVIFGQITGNKHFLYWSKIQYCGPVIRYVFGNGPIYNNINITHECRKHYMYLQLMPCARQNVMSKTGDFCVDAIRHLLRIYDTPMQKQMVGIFRQVII